jgi:hypothetical protein
MHQRVSGAGQGRYAARWRGICDTCRPNFPSLLTDYD